MKKKYNKPLTTNTTVRNEMNFCSSVYGGANKVESKGHEVGHEYEFSNTGTGSKKDGESDTSFGVTWE